MSLQEMKEAGWVRLMLADLFWISVFFTVWGSLIAFWNTPYALAILPVMVIMMTGFSELMHQGAHGNLGGRVRWLNAVVGRLAGAVIGIDTLAYRDFHLQHHKAVNTPEDSERPIYADPANVRLAMEWKSRSFFGRFASFLCALFMYMRGMLTAFNPHAPLVWAMRLAVPLVIAGIGYLEGLTGAMIAAKVAVCWYLPFLLYFVPDFFLAQSEHYGTIDKPGVDKISYEEQYDISWNLTFLPPITFMMFSRNMHAEHHLNPGIHWWFAREQKRGRALPAFTYLRRWWTDGPRMMSPLEPLAATPANATS